MLPAGPAGSTQERTAKPAPLTAGTTGKASIADLASVETPADLTAALNRLREASGKKSIRQVVISSGESLGRATVHDVLTGRRSKPAWGTVWALVQVFYGRDEAPDKQAWQAAWKRARNWAESERRRRSSDPRTPVLLCDPVALGVHPGLARGAATAAQPAYFQRDVDSDVRAAIARAREHSQFILLAGPQGAGKTRVAFEALRAEAPGFGLICPSKEDDLKGGLPPQTVIWLDNIDQCPIWPVLTPLLVQGLLRGPGPVIILGTISEQSYSACLSLHDASGVAGQHRQSAILNQATRFTVPLRLSAAELARAAEAQADPQIAAAIQAAGPELIQTLAAGRHLVRRWADADPYARAMISAAADARKAGIDGPIPRELLRDAARCYLSVSEAGRDAPGRFEAALAYAMATVPGGLAPLTADGLRARDADTPGYRVAGYLRWLREKATQGDPAPAAGGDWLPYLAPDRQLGEELAERGFTGPVYRAFEGELARYATGVLSRWPSSWAPASAGSRTTGGSISWTAQQENYRLAMVIKAVADVLPEFRRRLAADPRDGGNGESLAVRFISMCRTILPERICDPGTAPAERPYLEGNGDREHGGVQPGTEAQTESRTFNGLHASPARGGPGPGSVEREALPYSSDGPTVLRILLGSHLRKLRESEGIARSRAADAISSDESKLIRMELGRNAIQKSDVISLLALYGVSPEEWVLLLELAEQASRPGWWHRYHDILPEWFRAYLGMEEVARCIWAYEPQFIPGLLQTEEYASEVISLCDFPTEQAQRAVVLRKERQRRFADGDVELWAIVDEAALRRPVAGVDVQIGQLRYLREQCEKRPNLRLQVIPYGAGGYAAPTGFSVLEFAVDEAPDVVYVENLTGALYLDKEAEVARYRFALTRLIGVASDPHQTTLKLDQVIKELEERRNDLR
jgi:hypothetical protein